MGLSLKLLCFLSHQALAIGEGIAYTPSMKLHHYDHDGRARFITFCTHRRLPVLTNRPFRKIITDCLEDLRDEHHFRLVAYVIMPEHIHLIIVPREETALGKMIGELKKRTAEQIHKLLSSNNSPLIDKLTTIRDGQKRFTLWQRRCYDHNCRSEKSAWQMVTYCHENPVKRGLVQKPTDWEWSSCRWYEGAGQVVLEIDSAEPA